jgi:hypothetical protein
LSDIQEPSDNYQLNFSEYSKISGDKANVKELVVYQNKCVFAYLFNLRLRRIVRVKTLELREFFGELGFMSAETEETRTTATEHFQFQDVNLIGGCLTFKCITSNNSGRASHYGMIKNFFDDKKRILTYQKVKGELIKNLQAGPNSFVFCHGLGHNEFNFLMTNMSTNRERRIIHSKVKESRKSSRELKRVCYFENEKKILLLYDCEILLVDERTLKIEQVEQLGLNSDSFERCDNFLAVMPNPDYEPDARKIYFFEEMGTVLKDITTIDLKNLSYKKGGFFFKKGIKLSLKFYVQKNESIISVFLQVHESCSDPSHYYLVGINIDFKGNKLKQVNFGRIKCDSYQVSYLKKEKIFFVKFTTTKDEEDITKIHKVGSMDLSLKSELNIEEENPKPTTVFAKSQIFANYLIKEYKATHHKLIKIFQINENSLEEKMSFKMNIKFKAYLGKDSLVYSTDNEGKIKFISLDADLNRKDFVIDFENFGRINRIRNFMELGGQKYAVMTEDNKSKRRSFIVDFRSGELFGSSLIDEKFEKQFVNGIGFDMDKQSGCIVKAELEEAVKTARIN